MVRPKFCRKIDKLPNRTCFIVKDDLNNDVKNNNSEVILTLDEYEAIRLADFEGLYQEDASEMMNVSRQTFGRIIESAHKKLAEFLVNGSMLKIEGGNVEFLNTVDKCPNCKFGIDKTKKHCPKCKKNMLTEV